MDIKIFSFDEKYYKQAITGLLAFTFAIIFTAAQIEEKTNDFITCLISSAVAMSSYFILYIAAHSKKQEMFPNCDRVLIIGLISTAISITAFYAMFIGFASSIVPVSMLIMLKLATHKSNGDKDS